MKVQIGGATLHVGRGFGGRRLTSLLRFQGLLRPFLADLRQGIEDRQRPFAHAGFLATLVIKVVARVPAENTAPRELVPSVSASAVAMDVTAGLNNIDRQTRTFVSTAYVQQSLK